MVCSPSESMRPVVRRIFLAAWHIQKSEIVRAASERRVHSRLSDWALTTSDVDWTRVWLAQTLSTRSLRRPTRPTHIARASSRQIAAPCRATTATASIATRTGPNACAEVLRKQRWIPP